MRKLTEAQRELFQRASKPNGTRVFTGREAYTAETLIRRGLIATIPANGPLYYITEAGRRALESRHAD